MFKVNKDNKTISKMEAVSFGEINCKERQDLQEWIVSNPDIIDDNLLIIQKEFNGFSDTNERLDLLAIDKNGNLVIIENKTDDTGRDVVWQAVKYASYCSTLTTKQIREIFKQYTNKYNININSDEKLLELLGKSSFDDITLNLPNSQRIILVSKQFRKEVLSAAQWLLNFGIPISCIEVKPFLSGNDIFIDSNQILPQPELKDYAIKMAEKTKEDQAQQQIINHAEKLRNDFWKDFIPKFNQQSNLLSNISFDRKDHWLGCAASMIGGVSYNFLICKDYCGVELTIANSNTSINKKAFDTLYKYKNEIDKQLEKYPLSWERLDGSKMSRIFIRNENLSLFNTNTWDEIEEYLSHAMIDFESVLKKYAHFVKEK